VKGKTLKKVEHSEASVIRPKWPVIFSGLMAVALGAGFYYLGQGKVHAGSPGGLAYGIAGFAAILFPAAYRVRRTVYRFRLGSLQNWMSAHIYIGILSLFLILLHTGFRFHGIFSMILFVLFLLVIASGIIGAVIYNMVPLALAKYGREIVPIEEVEEELRNHLKEAEEYVADKSDRLREVFREEIKRRFFKDGAAWSFLLREEREMLHSCKTFFNKLREKMEPAEHYDIEVLKASSVNAYRTVFRLTKLKALRLWLHFHVPLTAAMITAALFHMVSVWYY